MPPDASTPIPLAFDQLREHPAAVPDARGGSTAHEQFPIPIPRDGSIADLLREARQPDRRFAAVICESIERVARRMYVGTKIEYELEQAGVVLCAAGEPIVTGRRTKRATPKRLERGMERLLDQLMAEDDDGDPGSAAAFRKGIRSRFDDLARQRQPIVDQLTQHEAATASPAHGDPTLLEAIPELSLRFTHYQSRSNGSRPQRRSSSRSCAECASRRRCR